MDSIRLIVDIAILAVLSGFFVSWLWRRGRAKHAADWPSTEGTIESGAMEVVARRKYGTVELPVFNFSYQVGAEYFGGRFALLPYTTDPSSSVIGRMIGRKLQVRYDPQHAESWFIPDGLIEGCQVEQELSPHLVNFKPIN